MIPVTSLAAKKPWVAVGIDVLEQDKFALLLRDGRDSRVGLVTNSTGLDSQGQRTIDVLARTKGIKLVALFSPEHSIAANADTTAIGNSKDRTTGIPIYSVYGKTDAERRPRPELLRGLDAVVFDLQDAGARFYTYETTLGYFLEACATTGVEMIVLDRPNPINGVAVQGPISTGAASFVNYHQLPVRHGLTIGELARLFNSERKINAKLRVIPMQGWKRSQWFDETGIAWVNPSPALRNLNAAALYPGVALLEQTNVSVGRGTDQPFEVVGAPWIEVGNLSQYMTARKIAGVRFESTEFTPKSSTHSGKRCYGIKVTVVDRDAMNSPALGIEIARALRLLYPKQFDIVKMRLLLANDSELEKLQKGDDPRQIVSGWQRPLRGFRKMRRRYLLYPELQ